MIRCLLSLPFVLLAVFDATCTSGAAASRELLTQYSMLMSHDAVSGEIIEDRDHVVADWTKTQSVGILGQLTAESARSITDLSSRMIPSTVITVV